MFAEDHLLVMYLIVKYIYIFTVRSIATTYIAVLRYNVVLDLIVG